MRRLIIGAGEPDRREGWETLDLRALPGIDHVQDARDLSNFPDGTFVEIFTKDCIEHISWRYTRATLKEWLRVLVSGGTIRIQTTAVENLTEILAGRGIGGLNYEPRFDFYNRIAYGDQGYPENTHLSYFRCDWLCELMAEAGFTHVTVEESNTFSMRVRGTKP